MSMHEYAEKEMEIAWGACDAMQEEIKKDVLQIIDIFSEQGHSGASGAYTLRILDRLMRFKPISPLTGDDDEWGEPYYGEEDQRQQNKRCSSVFRYHFDNRTAYDIDGKVFSNDGGKTFYSCRDSRIPVTFPYYPKEKPDRIILEEDLIPLPDKCKNCTSMKTDMGMRICHLKTLEPPDYLDVSTTKVDPESRPEWCPIRAINEAYQAAPVAQREKMIDFKNGLRILWEEKEDLNESGQGN